MYIEESESNSCLSVSAHLDTNQFRGQISNIQQLSMLTKKMHLPTILPHSTACWLFFFLSTEQESVNSHLFLSILGFAVYHQTCTSTFVSGQLVAGREEEDFTEEVSAQMLWKCSRGGQILGERTGQKAAAVR